MSENTTKSSRELPTEAVSGEDIEKSLTENYGTAALYYISFSTIEKEKNSIEGDTGTADAATGGKKEEILEYGDSNRTIVLNMIPYIVAGIEMPLKGKDVKRGRDTKEVTGPQKD